MSFFNMIKLKKRRVVSEWEEGRYSVKSTRSVLSNSRASIVQHILAEIFQNLRGENMFSEQAVSTEMSGIM